MSASNWLRCQFLAVVLVSQSEVAYICELSAFYHMAKQHSKGVSTQATVVYSPVYSTCAHTAAPDTAPDLLNLFLISTTQINFLIRNRAKLLA